MLYNKELKKVKKQVDCVTCKFFDKDTKTCKGIGKVCFEFDPKTQTCFDPLTKLAIRI